MSLSPGTRLGGYEIQSLLGTGGMGEVYCATDSRLGRLVAIKTLPPAFCRDPDRLARFRREAQILASLNHPHIAQIHGLDEALGQPFLVLELVDGESLDRRIARGPIAVDEALAIATQIADALAAAHDKGIVHRDLKPGNIALTREGAVKVLDFGLAKAVAAAAESIDAPTITSVGAMTGVGVIVGTAAYMAPEQAQGQAVDKRADVWAFGVIVFEMLTGERLFGGASTAEVLAAVATREPDWRRLPLRVRPALRRCLEKNPRRRLRDVGEFPFMIDESIADLMTVRGADLTPSLREARPTRPLPWMIATAILAVAAAVLAWRGSILPEVRDRALTHLDVDLGSDAVATPALETAVSDDGRRLAFVVRSADGTRALATRALDQAVPARLAGTEGAASPFFSPDGQWIGFFADEKLKKIPAQGGAVVTIANASASFGASWGDDQNIYFTPASITSIMRVPAGGGTAEPVLTKAGTRLGDRGDATHRWPQVLPGARAVLFTSHKIVAGFDDAVIDAVALDSGERKTVLKGGYFGRYVAAGARDGFLLYVRDGVLFAVPFDADALAVRGTAVPVIDDIAGDADTGAGEFAVGGGTLLYRHGKGPARRWPILWMDASGRTEPLIAEPGAYYTPRLSPDGTRLALTVDRGDRGREIEVYDWRRGTLLPLTHTGEINLFPVWSPDGQFIVFEAWSPRGYGLGVVRADGSGTLQRIAENNSLVIPYSFSPDGYLAYSTRGVWAARFDTTDSGHVKLGPPEALEVQGGPAFSPDGRWIAYRSMESGRDEVYVRRFHGSGAKWQVSTDGDGYSGIVWDPRAPRLYYTSPDHHIMAVDYTAQGDAFVAGRPSVWAPAPIGATVFPRNFSISADGTRFAVMPPRTSSSGSRAETVHVTFVLNFLDELRRRAPGAK